jgi:flagellar biosynthesis protein FliP
MSVVSNIVIGGAVVFAAAAAYIMWPTAKHVYKTRVDPYGTRFESAAARKRRLASQTRQYKAAWAEVDRQGRTKKKKTLARRSR